MTDNSEKTLCRFCLSNHMLVDAPLYQNTSFFVLGSIEPDRPHQSIIVPIRHVETPFDMKPAEWSDMADALNFVRNRLAAAEPDGYTIGWNVGSSAGQDVFHAHLHVIARFKNETSAGVGIHGLFRSTI